MNILFFHIGAEIHIHKPWYKKKTRNWNKDKQNNSKVFDLTLNQTNDHLRRMR